MSTKLLSIEELHFTYESNQEPTIKDLNLDVYSGEFLCLLAPSGAGKSTIFRLLTQLEKPHQGDIHFLGPSRNIGYMPQKDLLLEWRTVLHNVILPLELKGVKQKEAISHASRLLTQFGLCGTESKYPHELSGGMRQRASFLRAVIDGCDLLLLDEPFSALDAMTRVQMQDWLKAQCRALNITTILVTHDIEEALKLGTRILLFHGAPMSTYEELNVASSNIEDVRDGIVRQLRLAGGAYE